MTASDDKPGFLRRWSARKTAPPPPAPAPPPELPPIETLGPGSDFTLFLQPGVAPNLQRLALQRAWQTDAAIADFRGMAEYAWDFNAPSYGRLWAADNIPQLLADILTPPQEPAPPEQKLAQLPPPNPQPPSLPPGEGRGEGNDPAQPPLPLPRRHGSALPT